MDVEVDPTATEGRWLAQLWRRGKRLFGKDAAARRREAEATALYHSAVARARDGTFYTEFGVPDTRDGRLELIQLHVILLLRRLQRDPGEGPELGQALFDVFFKDVDRSLREAGVGDLSVGKWVRKIGQQFYARATAVEAALAQEDVDGLRAALASNVYAGLDADTRVDALARYLIAADKALATCVDAGTSLAALRFDGSVPIHPGPP